MEIGLVFFLNSIMLGVGLAMDAFSVSLVNGLSEPDMKRGKMCGVAGVFAFFQALMPMIGWICVHTVMQRFKSFEKMIPWIAFILLGYIGGKMLFIGIRDSANKNSAEQSNRRGVGFTALIFQGIATSIDALSVGFTIAEYDLPTAVLCALIIAAVTMIICLSGIIIGRKFGTALSDKASVLGGVILIGIGIEIFISGVIV